MILRVIKVFGSIYDSEEKDIYFNIISLNKKIFSFFGFLVSFILIWSNLYGFKLSFLRCWINCNFLLVLLMWRFLIFFLNDVVKLCICFVLFNLGEFDVNIMIFGNMVCRRFFICFLLNGCINIL